MTEGARKKLANIAEWMRVSKVSPNSQKTEFTILGHQFSTKKRELPETLELNGSEIKMVEKPNTCELQLMRAWIGTSSLSELEVK